MPRIYVLPVTHEDDLAVIRPLCERFFLEAGYPGCLDWDHFSTFWKRMIEMDMGRIYVSRGEHGHIAGVLGAMFIRNPFNGWPMTALSFWYVAPEFRGLRCGPALFDRAEEDGLARGNKMMLASHLFAINKDGGKRFFERKGFENHELGYRKIY